MVAKEKLILHVTLLIKGDGGVLVVKMPVVQWSVKLWVVLGSTLTCTVGQS